MNLHRFTDSLPEYLDRHQCLPLTEEAVVPALRAVYLPTFHHTVILTLRCPEGAPATLTVTSTEDFECHYHSPLEHRRPPTYSSRRARRRAQRSRLPQPEPPPPLTFPWPLAWWVLPATRRPPALFERVVVVPEDALARWRSAVEGIDLLMVDQEPELQGRDGMVTIGEVRLPHGSAAFTAWHPEAGTPWRRYFSAMLDLCTPAADDPLIAARLAELRRYQ